MSAPALPLLLAALLASGGGAAATWALTGSDVATRGNETPLDDNHGGPRPAPSAGAGQQLRPTHLPTAVRTTAPATRTTRETEPGDDHGGATREAEPGDDHGGPTSEAEPGDDHGGTTRETEPGDDHGGTTREPEPGDDHGGDGRSRGSDDRGGRS